MRYTNLRLLTYLLTYVNCSRNSQLFWLTQFQNKSTAKHTPRCRVQHAECWAREQNSRQQCRTYRARRSGNMWWRDTKPKSWNML